eukprot:gene1585-1926_t
MRSTSNAVAKPHRALSISRTVTLRTGPDESSVGICGSPDSSPKVDSFPSSDSAADINSGRFNWCNYWYPVHVLESIDPSRPHAVQLLGKQLATDDKAKATACSSSRSRLTVYPVREACGLVWVWPTAGPAAEAEAGPPGGTGGPWSTVTPSSWRISQILDKAAAMPFTNITSSIPQGESPEDQEGRPVFCFREQPPLATFTYPQGA